MEDSLQHQYSDNILAKVIIVLLIGYCDVTWQVSDQSSLCCQEYSHGYQAGQAEEEVRIYLSVFS